MNQGRFVLCALLITSQSLPAIAQKNSDSANESVGENANRCDGDGGKMPGLNWVAVDNRAQEAPGAANANSIAAPAAPASKVIPQSLDVAWWTGPMLAPSAATLPSGHFLIEPYLYDVTAPHSNGFGSLTYINYGLTDRVTVGVIPMAAFNKESNGLSSSGVGLGDVTLQAQLRLTQFHTENWIPTVSVVVQETLPTGKYDRLGNRRSDGVGSGAYTTTLALYSQTALWLPNGRILRLRFDLSQAFSNNVPVEDVSVYGTSSGFRGNAEPGKSFLIDTAFEYSLTRSWVLAFDATYRHEGSTRVTGYELPNSTGVQNLVGAEIDTGSSKAFGLAPAIEYSWKSNLGVLFGTRVILASRNTTGTITPVIAINYVY